jgi:hypothetical protein
VKISAAGTVIAAIIFALGTAGLSQAAAGELASPIEALRLACHAADGKFEDGWILDSNGVYWTATASCATDSVHLTCMDNLCRATEQPTVKRDAVLVKHKASANLGLPVRSDQKEFDRVLRGRPIR